MAKKTGSNAGTNFMITITLDQLEQLRLLRQEIEALFDTLNREVELKIGVGNGSLARLEQFVKGISKTPAASPQAADRRPRDPARAGGQGGTADSATIKAKQVTVAGKEVRVDAAKDAHVDAKGTKIATGDVFVDGATTEVETKAVQIKAGKKIKIVGDVEIDSATVNGGRRAADPARISAADKSKLVASLTSSLTEAIGKAAARGEAKGGRGKRKEEQSGFDPALQREFYVTMAKSQTAQTEMVGKVMVSIAKGVSQTLMEIAKQHEGTGARRADPARARVSTRSVDPISSPRIKTAAMERAVTNLKTTVDSVRETAATGSTAFRQLDKTIQSLVRKVERMSAEVGGISVPRISGGGAVDTGATRPADPARRAASAEVRDAAKAKGKGQKLTKEQRALLSAHEKELREARKAVKETEKAHAELADALKLLDRVSKGFESGDTSMISSQGRAGVTQNHPGLAGGGKTVTATEVKSAIQKVMKGIKDTKQRGQLGTLVDEHFENSDVMEKVIATLARAGTDLQKGIDEQLVSARSRLKNAGVKPTFDKKATTRKRGVGAGTIETSMGAAASGSMSFAFDPSSLQKVFTDISASLKTSMTESAEIFKSAVALIPKEITVKYEGMTPGASSVGAVAASAAAAPSGATTVGKAQKKTKEEREFARKSKGVFNKFGHFVLDLSEDAYAKGRMSDHGAAEGQNTKTSEEDVKLYTQALGKGRRKYPTVMGLPEDVAEQKHFTALYDKKIKNQQLTKEEQVQWDFWDAHIKKTQADSGLTPENLPMLLGYAQKPMAVPQVPQARVPELVQLQRRAPGVATSASSVAPGIAPAIQALSEEAERALLESHRRAGMREDNYAPGEQEDIIAAGRARLQQLKDKYNLSDDDIKGYEGRRRAAGDRAKTDQDKRRVMRPNLVDFIETSIRGRERSREYAQRKRAEEQADFRDNLPSAYIQAVREASIGGNVALPFGLGGEKGVTRKLAAGSNPSFFKPILDLVRHQLQSQRDEAVGAVNVTLTNADVAGMIRPDHHVQADIARETDQVKREGLKRSLGLKHMLAEEGVSAEGEVAGISDPEEQVKHMRRVTEQSAKRRIARIDAQMTQLDSMVAQGGNPLRNAATGDVVGRVIEAPKKLISAMVDEVDKAVLALQKLSEQVHGGATTAEIVGHFKRVASAHPLLKNVLNADDLAVGDEGERRGLYEKRLLKEIADKRQIAQDRSQPQHVRRAAYFEMERLAAERRAANETIGEGVTHRMAEESMRQGRMSLASVSGYLATANRANTVFRQKGIGEAPRISPHEYDEGAGNKKERADYEQWMKSKTTDWDFAFYGDEELSAIRQARLTAARKLNTNRHDDGALLTQRERGMWEAELRTREGQERRRGQYFTGDVADFKFSNLPNVVDKRVFEDPDELRKVREYHGPMPSLSQNPQFYYRVRDMDNAARGWTQQPDSPEAAAAEEAQRQIRQKRMLDDRSVRAGSGALSDETLHQNALADAVWQWKQENKEHIGEAGGSPVYRLREPTPEILDSLRVKAAAEVEQTKKRIAEAEAQRAAADAAALAGDNRQPSAAKLPVVAVAKGPAVDKNAVLREHGIDPARAAFDENGTTPGQAHTVAPAEDFDRIGRLDHALRDLNGLSLAHINEQLATLAQTTASLASAAQQLKKDGVLKSFTGSQAAQWYQYARAMGRTPEQKAEQQVVRDAERAARDAARNESKSLAMQARRAMQDKREQLKRAKGADKTQGGIDAQTELSSVMDSVLFADGTTFGHHFLNSDGKATPDKAMDYLRGVRDNMRRAEKARTKAAQAVRETEDRFGAQSPEALASRRKLNGANANYDVYGRLLSVGLSRGEQSGAEEFQPFAEKNQKLADIRAKRVRAEELAAALRSTHARLASPVGDLPGSERRQLTAHYGLLKNELKGLGFEGDNVLSRKTGVLAFVRSLRSGEEQLRGELGDMIPDKAKAARTRAQEKLKGVMRDELLAGTGSLAEYNVPADQSNGGIGSYFFNRPNQPWHNEQRARQLRQAEMAAQINTVENARKNYAAIAAKADQEGTANAGVVSDATAQQVLSARKTANGAARAVVEAMQRGIEDAPAMFQQYAPDLARINAVRAERAPLRGWIEDHTRMDRINKRPDLFTDDQKSAAQAALANAQAGMAASGFANLDQLKGKVSALSKEEKQYTNALVERTLKQKAAFAGTADGTLLVDRLAGKFKTLSTYMFAGGVLWGTWSKITQSIGTAIEMEKELADIQGTFVNKTLTDRLRIEQETLRASVQYGTNVREVMALEKTFAQAGMGTAETTRNTDAALGGVRGAGLSQQQASDLLIATRNLSNGRVAPEDIIDRITAVATQQPVTAQDLASGIQRAGSIASQLQPKSMGGMDAFDAIIGMQTEIVNQTRASGEAAATSIRFMLARLAQPEIQSKLQKNFGIKLAANEEGTELRPVTDILQSIAEKYNALRAPDKDGVSHTIEANELLATFAGARQVNSAAALFKDWDKVMKIARDSSTAYGETQRRLALQTETLAFKMEAAHAAFDGFVHSFMNSTGMMGLGKMAASATTGVLRFASGEGMEPGLAKDTAPSWATGAAGLAMIGGGAGLKALYNPLARRAAAQGTAAMVRTGSVAAGVAVESAGLNIAKAGVLIGELITPLGWLLATLATAAGLFALYKHMKDGEQIDKDKFGFKDISSEDLKNSEATTRYRTTAMNLGVGPTALNRAVMVANEAAMQAAIAATGLKRDELFTEDDKQRKYDPRVSGVMEQAYLRTLRELVPELAKVGDEADQLATAMSLLKDTAIYSGQVTGLRTAELREQLDNGLKALDDGFKKSARSGMPVLHSAEDFSKLSNASGLGAIKAMFGGGSPMEFKTWGMALNKVALEAMGSRGKGDATAERGTSEIVKDIFQGSETLANGFLKFSYKLDGKLVTVGNAVADAINKGGLTLGQALDKVTADLLEYSASETATLAQAEASVIGMAGDHAANVRNQLKTMGAAGQAVLDKQDSMGRFDSSMYSAMREQWDASGRVRDTVRLGGGLDDSEDAGGGAAMTRIMKSWERGMTAMIEDFKKQGRQPEAAALESAQLAYQNMRNRPQFEAQLNNANKMSMAGLVKDRILEVLIRYMSQRSEIYGAAPMLQHAGIGIDVAGESRSSTVNALRGMFQARAEIEGDLMRAAAKQSQFSSIRETIQRTLSTSLVNEGDTNERQVQSRKDAETIVRLLPHMDSKSEVSLQNQVNTLKGMMTDIMGNKELFEYLKPEQRQTFGRILGMNTDTKDGQARQAAEILLSFGSIVNALTAIAKKEESIVALRERNAKFSELSSKWEDQRLQWVTEQQQIVDNARVNVMQALDPRNPLAAMPLRQSMIARQQEAEDAQAERRAVASRNTLAASLAKGDYGTKDGTGSDRYVTDKQMIESQLQLDKETNLRRRLNRELELSQQTIAELVSRNSTRIEQDMQSSTLGFKKLITSFGSLREAYKVGDDGNRHVVDTLFAPLIDTLQNRMADNMNEALFGRNGVFGEALFGMFDHGGMSPLDMTREGTRLGVIDALGGNFTGKLVDMLDTNAGSAQSSERTRSADAEAAFKSPLDVRAAAEAVDSLTSAATSAATALTAIVAAVGTEKTEITTPPAPPAVLPPVSTSGGSRLQSINENDRAVIKAAVLASAPVVAAAVQQQPTGGPGAAHLLQATPSALFTSTFGAMNNVAQFGVSDLSAARPSKTGDYLVYDTANKTRDGKVPTHRLDGVSGRLPNETWEDYEKRVLTKDFSSAPPAYSSIDKLDDDVQPQFEAFMDDLRNLHPQASINESLRSTDRQEYLFQQGRKPGMGKYPSTWTLTSNHANGRAIDLSVPDIQGSEKAREKQWAEVWALAAKHGLTSMDMSDPGHIAAPAPVAKSVAPVLMRALKPGVEKRHGPSDDYGYDDYDYFYGYPDDEGDPEKKAPPLAPADKIKLTAPAGAKIDTPMDDAANFLKALPVGLGSTGTSMVKGGSKLVGSKKGEAWANKTDQQMLEFYGPNMNSNAAIFGSMAGGLVGNAALFGAGTGATTLALKGLGLGGRLTAGLGSASFGTRAASTFALGAPTDVVMGLGAQQDGESTTHALASQLGASLLFSGVGASLHAPKAAPEMHQLSYRKGSGWTQPTLPLGADVPMMLPDVPSASRLFDGVDLSTPTFLRRGGELNPLYSADAAATTSAHTVPNSRSLFNMESFETPTFMRNGGSPLEWAAGRKNTRGLRGGSSHGTTTMRSPQAELPTFDLTDMNTPTFIRRGGEGSYWRHEGGMPDHVMVEGRPGFRDQKVNLPRGQWVEPTPGSLRLGDDLKASSTMGRPRTMGGLMPSARTVAAAGLFAGVSLAGASSAQAQDGPKGATPGQESVFKPGSLIGAVLEYQQQQAEQVYRNKLFKGAETITGTTASGNTFTGNVSSLDSETMKGLTNFSGVDAEGKPISFSALEQKQLGAHLGFRDSIKANFKANKGALAQYGGQMVGQMGGGFIASRMNGGQNYGDMGATMGTTIGTMVGGPVGAMVGGLLGGVVGGLFKKHQKVTPEYVALEKIERNTREQITAIDNQTRRMAELDNRMLNVPATFSVPKYRPMGVGNGSAALNGTSVTIGRIEVKVDASGQSDPDAIGKAVATALRNELRSNGSFQTKR